MSCHRPRCCCLMILAIVCGTGGAALAQYEQLLARVPDGANTLVLIDVERLLASPLAEERKWKQQAADDFTEGRIVVSPQALRIVLASQIDTELATPVWEAALMDLKRGISLEKVAKQEEGYVDTVAGQSVAWTPRGAYVRKLAAKAAGLLFPANRQLLSKWLKDKSGELPAYLQAIAAERGPSGPQVTLAMDLEDAVSPQVIRSRIPELKSLEGATSDADGLVDLLATLQGLTLDLTVTSKVQGRVTVQFGSDAALLADVGKPLFLEILERKGAYIADFAEWTATVSGNTLVMEGELSKSGLLRISSVIELPSLPLDDSGRSEPAEDAGDPKLYASQRHFKSVQALVDDVRSQDGIDVKTLSQLGIWIEKYAQRIDRLPLVDVDPDMADYSAEVAFMLRLMASHYKGIAIRSGARQAQVSYNSDYGSGYDYYGGRAVRNERRRVKAEERATAATSVNDVWMAIDDATSETRQEMTERYKVEF